jgi:hypothetical protein
MERIKIVRWEYFSYGAREYLRNIFGEYFSYEMCAHSGRIRD